MEASEKQQLPLNDGAVRALDDRLVIERLTVHDERAASVVRERAEAGQPAAQTVTDAIEIGARVLDREDLSTEVDYVRAEFERTQGQLREQLTERARDLTERLEKELERVFGTEGGVMSAALSAHADELAEQVARHFDPERQTAVQNQVRELVLASLQDSRDALVKHLSSDGDSNPLAEFKRNVNQTMTEAVRQLRGEEQQTRERLEALGQQVASLTKQAEMQELVEEAEEAGTRKGRDFEGRVHNAIERIASARGDCAHHTGDQLAEGGGKKGDTVVEIGAADGPVQGRIVFEAKDKRGLSKQQAWRELNGSLDRRAADFAVLVVAGEDQIPSGREPLHEYEGNKMIAAVHRDDPDGIELEAAYRLAVARVRMAKTRSLTVDAAGVRNSVEAAVAALKDAQKIRSALTGAGKTIASVRESLDGMVLAVEQQLEHIESLIAAADQAN
jgi:hypothetical protein